MDRPSELLVPVGIVSASAAASARRACASDAVAARWPGSALAALMALTWWLVFGASPALAAATSLVTLDTRPGVTQKFVLIRPDQPVASVILFAGGIGVLNLTQSADGTPLIRALSGNFLVRTRNEYANRGFMVAVVDAPSDQQGTNGMNNGFRASAEHAQDIAAVVAHLRSEANLPVWLVGTSCGTVSAANNAIRLSDGVGGLTLTSSITLRDDCSTNLLSMSLDAIRVPTYVLAHDQDQCFVTPPSGAQTIVGRLTGAPTAGLGMLTGGSPPTAGVCDGGSPHGFLGVETQAVDAIAAFINGARVMPHSFSGTASGTLRSRVLTVTLRPAGADAGSSRQVFVAATVGAQLYFRTSAGWQLWTSGAFPAYSSGPVAAQAIQVFDGSLDLSGVAGAQIYVGYGTDSSEMLASGRYAMVHAVQ